MLNIEKQPTRTFVKLGFSHLETAEIVTNLNRLLANYHVHYQKLRNFHWNVEGPDFFELHEKFEDQYNEVHTNIDLIAERIRVFGKKPWSNYSKYLEVSEITEPGKNPTAFQMVEEVLSDYEKLLPFMLDVTESANAIGDAGTVDMMTTFIKKMEKSHWMFTAWMKKA